MRIVYMSYEGRFSDHPRALYETLCAVPGEHEHVWLADPDHRGGFPEDLDVVPYGGDACVEALESADLVIANTHFDLEWRKAPHTTYLQTWHGSPLKRIHHDVLWAPPGRLDRLDRDIAHWDLLLSPSPWATGIFRRAFRYHGEVLEIGAPRDDALASPDRHAVRAAVREVLGVPDGATAVLYAPTWRDDEVFDGDGSFALRLDVERLLGELGEDVHLLLRTHYMQTGTLEALQHARVHDASMHPDIRDLHLAADVLVTDYSSLLFDWVVTGKPIAFFAYDLERYRDEVRGFCFDLVLEAPGPVVRTMDALIDVLGDPSALPAAGHPAYDAFRRRYCPLEDGRAGARVLERLLAPPAADRQVWAGTLD